MPAQIDLAGHWSFRVDALDVGVKEQWFSKKLTDKVVLPGSMATNNKGDDIGVHTPWTGSIFDSSWFSKPEYAKYRRSGNIKVPFWLQPNKYYTGPAWYQKTITIPPAWAGKNIELFIERSHWETTVWADGQAMGTQNSLSTAQIFDLSRLKPGTHTITIRVNNKINDINVGPNSHSITDHTQTNWNGMIGKLFLTVKPKIHISRVDVYPDLKGKKIVTKVWVINSSNTSVPASVKLLASSENKLAEQLQPQTKKLVIGPDSSFFEWSYPMGNAPLLWDEFTPNLYSLKIELNSDSGRHEKRIQFGMKEFGVDGTRFSINGRKTFLRGTLESAIFPLTGYPATDTASWMRIFRIVKSYGLNHVRFHSWCPPEAAFDAADRSGIYLQVECASWANWGTWLGDGLPIDQYLYEESNRIVKAYGNHPSFCILVQGNEPGGKHHVSYLRSFVNYWKAKDPRRVYASGAGWPVIPENDFNNIPQPRIQQWEEGLKSIINKERPGTSFDWGSIISKYTIPTISHEIGQWCVYPDFKEMKKYTGVLQPKNFEIFRDRLKEQGLLHLADSFLLASGKLQVLCYKAEIEAALRTPGFGGFQLLDLHDFPGQGTALVGVLNPFWEDKGYISGTEFSRFCNTVVPLARFPKMVYLNNETLKVPVEISNFGAVPLRNVPAKWEITNGAGQLLFSGRFPTVTIPIGNAINLGMIQQSLQSIAKPSQLKLTVSTGTYQNSWDWFVYPAQLPQPESDILVTQQLDEEAVKKLDSGGKVLLTLKKGHIKANNGGDIAVGFSSIFWNTSWTNGQAPHTLGVLVNPDHAALKYFPTDYHSNYQWWDAMSHSNVVILDSLEKGLQPIIRVIDDWVTARSLGLVFECKAGNGRLIVSSIDLLSGEEDRPEARQLRYSLLKYMQSDVFQPDTEIPVSKIKNL
ncbi:glycoside hydrolase family 2 TIM barrel-domain containing protein [Niabella yanshanensis]|uniref:beta-galactosidase n=1 Tax=Niabella yanshanensis TaxID=577386 RepID=A0ABZ0W7L2_9BACT|nr:sugar-binding domain-containing protein [Niabella yanshanensis]WQD38005.1 glycoside hydrolase family 2 TIM barrel-domain containing protein [Niabella yanshanensis]